MRVLPRALGALSVVSLLTVPVAATSYRMVGDADLADQAAVIAEVVIGVAGNAAGGAATEYPVTVEQAVRGVKAGDRLTVRVPGGRRADGLSLQIWGAPQFRPGERALLFLAPDRNGSSFHILHLMLGAFHVRPATDGSTLAVRDLGEAKEVEGAGPDPARDLGGFRNWLTDRAAGARRAPDYLRPGVAPREEPEEKYTLLNSGGVRMRWFAFDEGGSVAWTANAAGQPGVPGGGFAEFQRALAAWDAEPATPVHYAYIGQTDATGGLSHFDAVNALQFDQPVADPFDCDRGGVLAVGGPWFDTRQRVAWGGGQFIPITGADIVTNAGIGCYLARSVDPSKAAEEIFAHELGHTLGLNHSCGDAGSGDCTQNPAAGDALMRAYLHNDGRGARLTDDDRAALQTLYGPGAGADAALPAAPLNLTVEVTGLVANLLWEDRTDDERGFRVYRAAGNGRLTRIAELPAGTTVYTDPGLKPGTRYTYQVAAFNARGESRGPRRDVGTSALQPLQALALASRSATVRTGEPVAFTISFSGPAKQARWDFPGGLELSDAPCAERSFCASHIFAAPGDPMVRVRLLGDLGQVSERTLQIHVEGPALKAADGTSFLPSVLSAPPGGAAARSDLWLANDGAAATLVRATFQPRAAGPSVARDLTLAPGATLFLPDVLPALFGAGGQQGSLTLSYLATGGTAPRVLAFSRARPGEPGTGSFGPLLPEEPEAVWSAGEKILAGLPGGDGSAATMLFSNLDETGGQATIDLYDSVGQPVGDPVALDLAPHTPRSVRLDRLFPALAGHTGPFSARIDGNGIRFSASAALVGGELQAPLFLAAREGIAGGELLIPRVSRGANAFNTFQFSRLLAANPSAQPREIRCELWLRGEDGGLNTGASRVAVLTIPPRGSIFVEDVLHDLYGLDAGTGALRITWNGAESPAPRVLSLAVSTSRGGTGRRFAALVDALSPREAATARSVVFGAEPSTFVRTSWGAINSGDAPAALRLSLRSASGEVVQSVVVTVPPRQHFERSLGAIFPQAGAGRWTVVAEVLGGGPVHTYLFQTGAGGDLSFLPGRSD